MSQALGLVTAAVQLGVEAILVKPKRRIGSFEAHVTMREVHTDEIEITDQPVEQGARISDHAYKLPASLLVECAWSDSPPRVGLIDGLIGAVTGTVDGISSILNGTSLEQVRDIYQKLLALQASREPFDVYTGKRVYTNMLIKSLVVETDRESENVLRVTAQLREVLIAQVQIVTIGAPAEDQEEPENTCPDVDKGQRQLIPATNINLSAAIDAITPTGLESVTGALL